MRPPRFKIRTLLGVVSLVAIGVAALRAADDLWDSGMLGLTSVSLLTSILLAVHRTDRRRAYWLGFSLFGWTYLMASLIPPIGPRLPTTRGLALLDSKIPGRQTSWVTGVVTYTTPAITYPVQGNIFTPQVNDISTSFQNNVWFWDTTTSKLVTGPGGTTENFVRIGHSILAILLALVGGQLSRYLYGQRREGSVLSPRDSPSTT